MATTQYIGARYVPVFADPVEWDSTRQYEPLTIVTHQGASYTSRQYVPAGIEITNESYWVLSANYNAQVETYRKEVRDILPYDTTPTENSTKGVTSDGAYKAITKVSDNLDKVIPLDMTPTENSTKGVTSDGAYKAITKVSDNLDKVIPLDMTPTENSTKGVTSGGAYKAIAEVSDNLDKVIPLDMTPTENSTKGVTSGGAYKAIAEVSDNLDKVIPLDTTPTENSTKGVTSGGVYEAINAIFSTPEAFGAIGDGKADDTQAITSALKSGKTILFTKQYKLTSAIDVSAITSNYYIARTSTVTPIEYLPKFPENTYMNQTGLALIQPVNDSVSRTGYGATGLTSSINPTESFIGDAVAGAFGVKGTGPCNKWAINTLTQVFNKNETGQAYGIEVDVDVSEAGAAAANEINGIAITGLGDLGNANSHGLLINRPDNEYWNYGSYIRHTQVGSLVNGFKAAGFYAQNPISTNTSKPVAYYLADVPDTNTVPYFLVRKAGTNDVVFEITQNGLIYGAYGISINKNPAIIDTPSALQVSHTFNPIAAGATETIELSSLYVNPASSIVIATKGYQESQPSYDVLDISTGVSSSNHPLVYVTNTSNSSVTTILRFNVLVLTIAT